MINRKNVCIIYTGGTIGMTVTKDGYAPQPGYFKNVLDSIPELKNPILPEWELIEFDPLLDSTDIAAEEWIKIGQQIEMNNCRFDGFVVLHGTDTMAYTASALSFMLEGLGKPVILTGSQIPFCELRSDARDNLITSLMIAGDAPLSEVCLYFGGRLLRGNRATKVSADGMNAFDSPNFPVLARAGIHITYDQQLFLPKGDKLHLVPFISDIPIAVLKIFPGIQFELFEGILTERLRGIVLEAFGSGNVPAYDKALLPLIRKAVDNGTVVTVCTQCLHGTVDIGAYASSAALKQNGVVSGVDMTVESAVTKLYYLFSKGCSRSEIIRQMPLNLRGELTDHT